MSTGAPRTDRSLLDPRGHNMALLRTISSYLPASSLFIRFFFFGGIIKANGVILSSTVESLRSTNTAVAWAFTLQSSLAYMTTPLGGYLMKYLTPRQLGVIGGFLTGLGYVLSGIYLDSVWLLYVYHSLAGLGLGLWCAPNWLYIHTNYRDSCEKIFAASVTFMYIGVALCPLILQWFIDRYGYSGGKACFGAFIWNCILGGVLHRPTSESGQTRFGSDLGRTGSDRHFLDEHLPSCVSAILRHRKFAVLVAFSMVAMYVYSSWAIFLVSLGEARGFTSQQAVFLSTIGGIGGFAGSFIGQVLVHLHALDGYTCWLIPTMINGISLTWCALTDDLTTLCILTFSTGLAQAVQYTGIAACIPLVLCGYHTKGGLNTSYLAEGIASQIGGAISGLIQDSHGSPEMVFGVCALLSFMVAPLAVVWILDGPTIEHCYEGANGENAPANPRETRPPISDGISD